MTSTIQTLTVSPEQYVALVWADEIREAVAARHGSIDPCIGQMRIDIRHGLTSDVLPAISLKVTHGDAVWTELVDPDVATRYEKRIPINARIANWHENEAHAFGYAGN